MVKNAVRGFSLVPGLEFTTLKGDTAIVFGIQFIRLPRPDKSGLAMTERALVMTPHYVSIGRPAECGFTEPITAEVQLTVGDTGANMTSRVCRRGHSVCIKILVGCSWGSVFPMSPCQVESFSTSEFMLIPRFDGRTMAQSPEKTRERR